ncbi:tRNA (adenosine(37)-N6)-dimethylallyltransferase MiaA [Actinomycetospora cinnamomea]|uniref:tRNA dimethylallyltransferase n=1 Tax=Actinomycetospora cinnamomea TaxID=663609 RepID=A0A2U1FQ70_9PSEU|nr:tRNA (adenosine(37)-N6)-dimethylallyltransferase MiaA [Actinomycetospora cinnamomea]PVZ14331.1 tRNA dimethylallyltransferase [Actinomycetospora cinnamomea]
MAAGSAAVRPIALVGPTATGKSDLALDLAQALARRGADAEVVNADAMQLYRGMDIGTAKLPPGQRRGVPHHLLDVLDVTETATVAAYQRDARAAVDAVRARGRVPLVVGGSGLYVQAVLDDLEFPGTDPRLRARLDDDLATLGPAAMHARLAARDPDAARGILASNGRRIVRALEVVELTGRPFAASLPRPGVPRHDALLVGLDRDTDVLDDRIAARVDGMLAAGLVDEVRALAERGLREGVTASRAVGYREVLAHLDGAFDLDEARRRTVVATRRLVRRQRSWFRRDDRVRWLDAAAPDVVAVVLGRWDRQEPATGAPSRRA